MKQIASIHHNKRQQLLHDIAQVVFDKKGKNIMALDVRGHSTLTDFCLIAEGHVDKHTQAIAHAIQDHLKAQGEEVYRLEGHREGSWVVLDYGDIMVHLFQAETRAVYQLERLWPQAHVMDLNIDVTGPSTGHHKLYSLPPDSL